MDDDFAEYEVARANGSTAEDACKLAARGGRDWTFCIRLLRTTYGLDLVEARDLLMKSREVIVAPNGS
jgi:hypothetical protein